MRLSLPPALAGGEGGGVDPAGGLSGQTSGRRNPSPVPSRKGRGEAIAFFVFAIALHPAQATEREVELPGRPASLRGTLSLPAGGHAGVPGVLLLGGSGPIDRNGNQPGMLNGSLRKLADGMAQCGIATLRIDKRGIGASAAAGPEEEQLTFDTYVADAADWLNFLRAQPRVRGVSALGHGEGGLVATRLAMRARLDRLVLIAAPGRRASVVLRDQLAAIDMAPVLRQRTDATIRALERGETVDDPPKGMAALFRPSVQPYLISWFKLDPRAELARVSVPTLVIQGATDLQVSVADARLLASARPGVRLDVVEGMNHVLRAAPLARGANLASYTSPELPLMAGLAQRVCGFVTTP